MYEINPQISDFVYLHFDGDQRLIFGRNIYRLNDDIIFRLKNGLILDILTN